MDTQSLLSHRHDHEYYMEFRTVNSTKPSISDHMRGSEARSVLQLAMGLKAER
jgi:hypothetical protein